MNTTPGEDVALSFQVELDDAELDTATAKMRVVGPLGVIADWTDIEYENEDPTTFNFLVDGAYNVMQPGATREARLIDIEVDAGSGIGIQRFTQEYLIIQDLDELVFMTNSFVSYVDALTKVTFLPKHEGWDQADAVSRRSALISAYDDISHMSFDMRSNRCNHYDRYRAMWHLTNHPIISHLYRYSPADFLNMPEDFRHKITLAQVAEADSRLGSDAMQDYRSQGILMERAGENVTSFRNSSPLKMRLNRRTYEILGSYIEHNPRLTRG